jgi:uncharacterized protein YjbI with pentapeptide repeats
MMSFAGADIRGVVFDKSDLRGVSFQGAKFRNPGGGVELAAFFACVNAAGANFSRAVSGKDYHRVRFRSETESGCSDFTGANFTSAKIPESDFNSVRLSGAQFVNADLSGSTFRAAKLSGASFRDANLTGVDFVNADLSGADFTGAILKDNDFYGAKTDGAIGL